MFAAGAVEQPEEEGTAGEGRDDAERQFARQDEGAGGEIGEQRRARGGILRRAFALMGVNYFCS